ncbi:MAG: 5-formyltetrahydrofolate cyclo-ligase [Candidatus Omnitrophica bacterium CG08_land_8_20_14_0_20_41_16]|uniref:5-formyltetrahydrofolate cyclo-ligase n=1 Tax=Candidatus Sherwoodlollariibacterium unditelluris TaxID=1974757 RepID=A0A2G9YKR0_9BACT|nr:MAG: 5-formyltetrahydrofolate cyclo-ligase [Candidatus Omnitrophica bacterium CG23_combo_of_CG06-09_8_20_14_all_41_10]PIS33511.1 MAG: 5-formyltetrahydrofolate cyclo-ligase [Candidatus Omnitrophica bacterium CG08_land_8_20_14_0_20_41_16]
MKARSVCKMKSAVSAVEPLTKQEIRSKILIKLKKQKEEDRRIKSCLIKRKLFKQAVFKKAKRVMFYIALKGEVETKEMIEAAQRLGKIIAVPVCVRNKASLRPALLDSLAHLKRGPYGVSEPVISRFIALKDLDLVITPGVAFDKKGNRLGRGKGYYDRFLSNIPKDTPSIGLAYSLQILLAVPVTTHDVNVKKVLFA